MKAFDEYFLMVVATLLLNRVHGFALHFIVFNGFALHFIVFNLNTRNMAMKVMAVISLYILPKRKVNYLHCSKKAKRIFAGLILILHTRLKQEQQEHRVKERLV